MLNSRVIVTAYGGPEVLTLVQEPLRMPDQGEVRVKVQSSGVALADIMRREGKFPNPPTPPFTPGYDAVGVIDELGEDVKQFRKGDKVAVFFNGTGGYAAYVYAKPDELVAVPQQMDSSLTVAAVLNYVTAYQMLHRIAKVSEGESILIHGASGGTGTALLELGRLAKLKMYGTASLAKHHIISGYGAIPIDYRNEDFVDVLRLHAPEGIDAVFDPIGGENYQRSLRTLSGNGRFVSYGYTSVLQERDSGNWEKEWSRLAKAQMTEQGHPMHLYSITLLKKEQPDWFREDASAVLSLLEEGLIHPLVSHRIPLEEAAKAQELLERSLAVGKVVLIS